MASTFVMRVRDHGEAGRGGFVEPVVIDRFGEGSVFACQGADEDEEGGDDSNGRGDEGVKFEVLRQDAEEEDGSGEGVGVSD